MCCCGCEDHLLCRAVSCKKQGVIVALCDCENPPLAADCIRMHVIIFQLAEGRGNHSSSSTFGTRWTEKNSMTWCLAFWKWEFLMVIVSNYTARFAVLDRFLGRLRGNKWWVVPQWWCPILPIVFLPASHITIGFGNRILNCSICLYTKGKPISFYVIYTLSDQIQVSTTRDFWDP